MLFTHEYSKLCRLAEQDGKGSRRKKMQLEKRTHCASANGFLKYSFTSVISRDIALLGQAKQIQHEFFSSLSNLAEFYQLDISCTGDLYYPFNIQDAFEKAKKAFDRKPTGLHLIISKDSTHKVCISTVKTYDTGQCLYYLPIKPLVSLLHNRQTKKQSGLLLSVSAACHAAGLVIALKLFINAIVYAALLVTGYAVCTLVLSEGLEGLPCFGLTVLFAIILYCLLQLLKKALFP